MKEIILKKKIFLIFSIFLIFWIPRASLKSEICCFFNFFNFLHYFNSKEKLKK